MTMRNDDEKDSLHFRSDRIVQENGAFYFATREGTVEGPFRSREQAEVAAAVYIRHHLDPSKRESMQHDPDPHFYRYADRRTAERRQAERRSADRRRREEEWGKK
jgi:hypothetical protein